MTKLATRSNLLSNILAYEQMPEFGVCRETVTVTTETGMDIGAVLVKSLTSITATPVTTGTGNGAIGTITVADYVDAGVYVLKIIKAATNAGDFIVFKPNGSVMGYGTVGVAYSQGGIGFTLADGSSDFVVGDIITITITGTVKYKWVKAAYVATLNDDVVILVDSYQDPISKTAGDYSMSVLKRGHAGVVGSALQYGDTLSGAQKTTVLDKLKVKNILNRTQV